MSAVGRLGLMGLVCLLAFAAACGSAAPRRRPTSLPTPASDAVPTATLTAQTLTASAPTTVAAPTPTPGIVPEPTADATQTPPGPHEAPVPTTPPAPRLGGEIALASVGNDNPGIFLIDPNDGNVTRIGRYDAENVVGAPTWSPDGKRLALAVFYGMHRYEIWVMNSDGTGLRSVGSGAEPVWAPDGRRIAFVQDDIDEGTDDVYVMNSDGSGLRRLTTSLDTETYPRWIDSHHIAYLWQRRPTGEGYPYELRAIDADTGRPYPYHGPKDLQPGYVVSPDGQQIAQPMLHGDSSEIYVMRADGSGMRQITSTTRGADSPTWAPDSEHLAFMVDLSGVYVADADGSGQRLVYRVEAPAAGPIAWSPVGVSLHGSPVEVPRNTGAAASLPRCELDQLAPSLHVGARRDGGAGVEMTVRVDNAGKLCRVIGDAALTIVDSSGRPVPTAGNPATLPLDATLRAGSWVDGGFILSTTWTNWCRPAVPLRYEVRVAGKVEVGMLDVTPRCDARTAPSMLQALQLENPPRFTLNGITYHEPFLEDAFGLPGAEYATLGLDAVGPKPGSKVYRVQRYQPQYLLFAYIDGQLTTFEAQVGRHGRDLLDVDGQVKGIGIKTESGGAVIRDRGKVAELLGIILAARVDWSRERTSEERGPLRAVSLIFDEDPRDKTGYLPLPQVIVLPREFWTAAGMEP